MRNLLRCAVLLTALSLAGCAAMTAARRDADGGTPFAHAPYAGSPVDWAGYLVSLVVSAAAGAGCTHAVHRKKKKAPNA